MTCRHGHNLFDVRIRTYTKLSGGAQTNQASPFKRYAALNRILAGLILRYQHIISLGTSALYLRSGCRALVHILNNVHVHFALQRIAKEVDEFILTL